MRASKAQTGKGRGEGMQRSRRPSRPPLSRQHTCCRGRSSRVPVVPLRCSLCCCSLVVRGVGPEGLEVTPHQLGIAVHRNQVLPHHICSRRGGRPNSLLSGPCCDSGFRADTLHGRPLRPCQSHTAVHAKLLGQSPRQVHSLPVNAPPQLTTLKLEAFIGGQDVQLAVGPLEERIEVVVPALWGAGLVVGCVWWGWGGGWGASCREVPCGQQAARAAP